MAEEHISDLTQNVQALETVSENLSELLTNSVNMVDKYYEIFFDPEPHYVELEQYNSDGNIFKTLVPNRALDRSVALSGNSDPENLVEGVLGSLYVNTVTRDLYIKKTESGINGWVNITPQKIEFFTEQFEVDSATTEVLLLKQAYAKENIDIYFDGRHLEDEDFELGDDRQTIYFHTQFIYPGKLQVKYVDGLYGLKGDTALTVKIGKVETVNSETPASVVNVGDDENVILDFAIPKGATGDTGVWIGSEEPVENKEYLDDKKIWVDTSADGYSEEELSVTRIFDSGNSTNPMAYRKAYTLKHSSIDANKYAVLGDVNIDDNGILTSYGNGSGIRTTVKVEQLIDNDWSISGRDYIDVKEGTHQYMFNIGGQTTDSIVFFFRSSNKSFCFYEKSEDIIRVEYDNNSEDIYDVYGAGWYNWKIEYKKGQYNVYISYNDYPLALRFIKDCEPINQPLDEFVYISADNLSNYSQMKSNLAVFTIRINDEIIWTPNKTGYEIIQEDNFVRIGNPSITDNGILNYITSGVHYIHSDYKAVELLNKSWEIEGQFIYTGNSQVLWQFADPNRIEARPIEDDILAGDYKMLSVVIDSELNQIQYFLRTGLIESMSDQKVESFDLELGKEYTYKLAYNEDSFIYTFTLTQGDTTQTQEYFAYTVERNPLVCNSHPEYVLMLGCGSHKGDENVEVYNDLNKFRVYNRGRLVYRPLFRIPITISKYGVKFVDSKYRWMVEEAYKLHGEGHLYIIDEENYAVNLPLNDIYSLIQKEYDSRPKYGKGLRYNAKTNTVENLTQGSDIGDVGESVFVDETTGMRRVLNGQAINVTPDTEEFTKYVLKLKKEGLVVTEEEWQAELAANGICNKFVVDVETKEETKHYYAYIPETFVIRTPIIDNGDEPDIEENIPERYCSNCGAPLEPDQVICNECFTINEIEVNGDDNIIEGDNITHDEIMQDQEQGGSGGNEGEELPEEPEEPDNIIGYDISISSELTEADVVYITSYNTLDKDVVFRRINNIIYPEYDLTVDEIINDSLFYRVEDKDFEITEEVESANYIRLPKLNASKAGYQCYIQIATGVKNTVDIENTYTHISPFSYGMYQYSDIELNNPGWLLSEGQWNSGAMYPSFYRWIRKQIDLGRDKFKLWNNPNYSVTRYDYVINEADGTFRLPLVASVSDFAQKRFLVAKKEMTESNLTWYNLYSDGWCEQGGDVNFAAYTTNRNYTITLPIPYNDTSYYVATQLRNGGSSWAAVAGSNVTTKTTNTFIIQKYQASGTGTAIAAHREMWRAEGYAHNPALEAYQTAYLYFYVGDTVQSNRMIDMGVALDEIAKLKRELDNKLSCPASTYTNIGDLANNAVYTAPASGWVTFRRTATAANQYLGLQNTVTGLGELQWLPASGNWAIASVAVRKGDKINILWNAGTYNYLRFIPSK